MRYRSVSLALMTAVFAAATVGTAQSWSVLEAEQAAGKHLFDEHCSVCHGEGPGRTVLAPSLRGVVGRPAASVAGFQYSQALKTAGLTWTEDNLRRWISDNRNFVPGTLMPHVSIPDPAETIYLVAYLKTLKAPRNP